MDAFDKHHGSVIDFPVQHMNDKDSNLAKDNAVTISNLFKGRKVAFFGIPAPFTGTCTTAHYPPYRKLQDDFLSQGVDEIVCYSVADPYSHFNWGKVMGNNFDKISFLADVDCEWAAIARAGAVEK